MKSVLLLISCLNFINCIEHQIRAEKLKPTDFYTVQLDSFDSIYVNEVRLNENQSTDVFLSKITIRPETLKSGLEQSILESKLVKKISNGIYSIDLDLLKINANEFYDGARVSFSFIKYSLFKNKELIKEYKLDSRFESTIGKVHPRDIIEKSIQQNFQKFIFELSKEKF
jgi:hypothetical protein